MRWYNPKRWFNLTTGIVLVGIIVFLVFIGMIIVGLSLWNVPKAKELFPFLEISEVFPTKAIALFTGLATFGTLVLALTTIVTIKNNNEREKRRREDELDKEKRDRKERLLNEIIGWAIDVSKKRSESKKIFKEMAGITDTKQQERFTHAHIVEVKESYVGMSGKNRYIENITPESEQGLRDAVVKLIDDLEAYIEFLDEWGRVKADAIAHNVIKEEEYITREGEYTARADEHVSQLEISSNKVIEEAANIKTRDIG